MSNTFKFRPSKLKFTKEHKTLDEIHNDTLQKFDNNNLLINQKKQKIIIINKKIEELSIGENNFSKINNLKSKIKELNNEITDLSLQTNELDYFEKTRDILLQYYLIENQLQTSEINNIARDNTEQKEINDSSETEIKTDSNEENKIESNSEIKNVDTSPMSNDTILDRLNRLNEFNNKNVKEKKPIKKKKIKDNHPQYKPILSFLENNNNEIISQNHNQSQSQSLLTNYNHNQNQQQPCNEKGTLKSQYLALTDTSYLCEKVKQSPIKNCQYCNIEKTLIQSEGIYVCQNCGKFEYVIIESEIPSHKDSMNEKPKYPYKTINHLIERLNQFQAKQTTLIPSQIYDLIKYELKKMLIDEDTITPIIIKKILKKYRLNTYYEHNFLIYSHITNTPPPSLTRDEEDVIKLMFRQTETPFKKYKPNDRANYLNYSYVLHKLFLILADKTTDNLIKQRMIANAKYFSLLKSRDKLRMQDLIWKNICKDLAWNYHPSF